VTLIRRRFWSSCAEVSDEQLEAGMAELSERHPEELLRFEDRLEFIVGARL